MPCNSNYMEPTLAEVNSKQVAVNLVYVCNMIGATPPSKVVNAAASMYGDWRILDEMVVRLCGLISEMTDEDQSRIIYNGRNAEARKLAMWWDEHKAADLRRGEEEVAAAIQSQDKEAALSKLTPYEKELLGLK